MKPEIEIDTFYALRKEAWRCSYIFLLTGPERNFILWYINTYYHLFAIIAALYMN